MATPEYPSPGEPIFLTLDEVLQIHKHQIATYGGGAGVRDLGLIESATVQPRLRFGGTFLHPDLAAMAAAYLFHIVSNHGFIDGNKRTGAHASLVFLALNGVNVEWDVDAAEILTLGVARGEVKKGEVIKHFRALVEGNGPLS